MELFESIYKKARLMEANPDKYPDMDWLTPDNSHYDKVKSTRDAENNFQYHTSEAYDMDDYYDKLKLTKAADEEEEAAWQEYLSNLDDNKKKEIKDWQVEHAYNNHNAYIGDKGYEIEKDFKKKEKEFAATQHHIDDDYSKSNSFFEIKKALNTKGIDVVGTLSDWNEATVEDWEFSEDCEDFIVPVRQIISYKNKEYLLVIPYSFYIFDEMDEVRSDYEYENDTSVSDDELYDYVYDWVERSWIKSPKDRNPDDAVFPTKTTDMKPMCWSNSPTGMKGLARYYSPVDMPFDSMYLFNVDDSPLDDYDDPDVKELVVKLLEVNKINGANIFWKEDFSD